MLAYCFSDRPTIEEIKAHKWFNLQLPTQEKLKGEVIQMKMYSVNHRIAQEIKTHISEE